jgi:hypothetical protein
MREYLRAVGRLQKYGKLKKNLLGNVTISHQFACVVVKDCSSVLASVAICVVVSVATSVAVCVVTCSLGQVMSWW